MLILKHFVDSVSLLGLRLSAADVTGSGYANAVDALLVARRFAGAVDSFPAGDWHFEERGFYTLGIGQGHHHLRGICLGDVDASYDPAKQLLSDVRLFVSPPLSILGVTRKRNFRAFPFAAHSAASLR